MFKFTVLVNCHQLRHNIYSHFETIIDQSKITDAKKKSGLKLTNIFPDLNFTDMNFTDFIFTDIIIHAKASSVQVMTMSVIIMSDNV